jgi:5-methylcytosine-specific restriction endonuclease McrA
MKATKLDVVEVWKELEDVLAPRLRLDVIEHRVYAHLLRHTRLERKLRLRFSIPWLARGVALSNAPAREGMRRLAEKGVLRLIERSNIGHLVEVRLPKELRAAGRKRGTVGRNQLRRGANRDGANLEQMDFLRTRELRQAIHAREGGKCFYCMRRTPSRSHCLDHVVPRAESGLNSYRNVVSCCMECNWQKRAHAAEDFLREMYREGRLSREELSARLQALRALAAGKLRPKVPTRQKAGEGNDVVAGL